jgi:hypothetical protein
MAAPAVSPLTPAGSYDPAGADQGLLGVGTAQVDRGDPVADRDRLDARSDRVDDPGPLGPGRVRHL